MNCYNSIVFEDHLKESNPVVILDSITNPEILVKNSCSLAGYEKILTNEYKKEYMIFPNVLNVIANNPISDRKKRFFEKDYYNKNIFFNFIVFVIVFFLNLFLIKKESSKIKKDVFTLTNLEINYIPNFSDKKNIKEVKPFFVCENDTTFRERDIILLLNKYDYKIIVASPSFSDYHKRSIRFEDDFYNHNIYDFSSLKTKKWALIYHGEDDTCQTRIRNYFIQNSHYKLYVPVFSNIKKLDSNSYFSIILSYLLILNKKEENGILL